MVENLGDVDILQWLESLGLAISSVDDVGKGTLLCQILNLVDNARLSYRVSPATENDYMYNLLLVKNHMGVKGESIKLPIEKMCKLSVNDNLEVLKWFYGYWKKREGIVNMNQSTLNENGVAYTGNIGNTLGNNMDDIINTVSSSLKTKVALQKRKNKDSINEALNPNTIHKEQEQRFADLLEILRVFENERDFYFDKLVSIENLLIEGDCREYSILKEKILNILYEIEFKEE